jgi:predicted phosphodiesterase
MKVALYSDLHLEFGVWSPPATVQDAEVIILAGDIALRTSGLRWAASAFPGKPVIYVCGNHEFYGNDLNLLTEMRALEWEKDSVYFLENSTIEVGEVRFLGCTLWSGFDLYGPDTQQALAMSAASRSILDYRKIGTGADRLIEPADTLAMYLASASWLDTELSKPFAGKTVVVTHFAPHRGCIPPQFEGSDLSPYFVSDLSWLMTKHRINLWCHGHTHTSNDFVAENGCRVVSNQRGYPKEQGVGFRPELVIEV